MKNTAKYRIRNWKQYNKSLIQRGSITIWFSEDVIASWLANPSATRGPGRPFTYSDEAVLCALMIRLVFHLPLRALQGFLQSMISILGLCIPVPHYSRICRRAATLNTCIKRFSRKRPTDLVFDSTGLRVYGEGEWKVRQHGKSKRRTWRKVHLAICPDSHEILMGVLTENNVADCSVMEEMSGQIPTSVERVYADGAYDTSRCRKALVKLGIDPIIPPQKNAILQAGSDDWQTHRNASIKEIRGLGGDDEAKKLWKRLRGYHRRSLGETATFRLKKLFGSSLRTRKFPYQKAEIYAACLAINKMNALGMPKSFRW